MITNRWVTWKRDEPLAYVQLFPDANKNSLETDKHLACEFIAYCNASEEITILLDFVSSVAGDSRACFQTCNSQQEESDKEQLKFSSIFQLPAVDQRWQKHLEYDSFTLSFLHFPNITFLTLSPQRLNISLLINIHIHLKELKLCCKVMS